MASPYLENPPLTTRERRMRAEIELTRNNLSKLLTNPQMGLVHARVFASFECEIMRLNDVLAEIDGKPVTTNAAR